jgi:hypothetical protein
MQRDLIHEASAEMVCQRCGYPCELKFNGGDPVWVCENDSCRKIQTDEWIGDKKP